MHRWNAHDRQVPRTRMYIQVLRRLEYVQQKTWRADHKVCACVCACVCVYLHTIAGTCCSRHTSVRRQEPNVACLCLWQNAPGAFQEDDTQLPRTAEPVVSLCWLSRVVHLVVCF
jgi:hypothetical protein